MTRKLRSARGTGKNHRSQNRDQISQRRNQISAVMQKVKGLLPSAKAAQTLALLIDEPLGACQKLLCGERVENAAVLTKLLLTDEFGLEVLLTIGEGRCVRYIEQARRAAGLKALRKQISAAEKLYADGLREMAQ